MERAELAGRLEQILDRELTVEKIDTYMEDTLEKLLTLTDDIVHRYESHHPHTLSGKHLEDAAFREYGLPEIDDYLDQAGEQAARLHKIDEHFKNTVERTSETIIPPDKPTWKPLVANGTRNGDPVERPYGQPKMYPRVKSLLYLLDRNDIPLDTLTITKGAVPQTMLRKESYVVIAIPELNRLVELCDEEGNATYIFALDQMRASDANRMTKEEKKGWIDAHPGAGVRIVHSPRWIDEMEALLWGEFSEPADFSSKIDIPEVSRRPIDRWRGWYRDPVTGKHWGPVASFVRKYRRSFPGVQDRLEGKNMQSVLDLRGARVDAYCYEEAMEDSAFASYLRAKEVATAGAWKDFYTDPRTDKHWGSVDAFVMKSGVTRQIVDHVVETTPFRTMPILTKQKKGKVGYAFEDLVEHESIQEHMTAPVTEATGEWAGFRILGNTHRGSYNAIARRYHVDPATVKSHATKAALTLQPAKSGIHGAIEQTLCLEELLEKSEKFKQLEAQRKDKVRG